MEKLELKCYELKSDFIVVTSQGKHLHNRQN